MSMRNADRMWMLPVYSVFAQLLKISYRFLVFAVVMFHVIEFIKYLAK